MTEETSKETIAGMEQEEEQNMSNAAEEMQAEETAGDSSAEAEA